jgi:Flp pilus assembly protein TadB
MKRGSNQASERRRRRMFTILWTALLSVGVIVLLYKEMTALLYILATLGVTALLLVVAMADLRHAQRLGSEDSGMDDSAAIGSGIRSTTGKPQA